MTTLSDDQVRQLRTRRVINREYLGDLAREFGISPSQALRIVRGEFRAKAGGPLEEEPIRLKRRRDFSGENNPNYSILPEDKALMRQLLKDGATQQAVAEVMMCSRATVSRAASEILPEPEALH